jgi:hypothetical protein
MGIKRKVPTWVGVIVLAAAAGIGTFFLLVLATRPPVSFDGAVIRQSSDPNKELPIADAEITAIIDGIPAGHYKSDSFGFFHVVLPKSIRPIRNVLLLFRHPGYDPFDVSLIPGTKLYVIRMTADQPKRRVKLKGPVISISNISVRYTVKATTALNVGSKVKTFEVVNIGNIPCNGHHLCSPDGMWKAAKSTAILDAGEGDVFRNVRVSCIAGPCPFTKIQPTKFSDGGRTITVSALDWSDTATFLIEADVFHPMASDDVRTAYPVVFGQTLSFTVPASAEGVSLEADVNGDAIIFPLGPDLLLPWATCMPAVTQAQTRTYRCESKPGYQF